MKTKGRAAFVAGVALIAWFFLVTGDYLAASLPFLGSLDRFSSLQNLPGWAPVRLAATTLGWVRPLLAVLLVLAAVRSFGRWTLSLILGRAVARLRGRLLWEMTLGLGVLGTLLTGIGFDGLLRPPLLIVILAAGAIPALALPRGKKRPKEWSLPAGGAVFALFALVSFAGQLAGALSPEIEIDSLGYHLGKVSMFLRTGHIAGQAWNLSFRFASHWELLLVAPYAIGGEAAAKLLNPAVALLTALLLASSLRKTGAFGGVLAGALYLSAFPVSLYAGTLKNDLLVSLFALASFLAAVEFRRSGGRRWVLLAGLFAGFGLATKSTALLSCAVSLGMVAWPRPLARPRPRAKHLVSRLPVTPALLYGGAALFVVLPWLVWNLHDTGNPFYPLATRWFGGLDDFGREMLDHEGYGYLRGDYHSLSGRLAAAWGLAARDAGSPLPALALPAAALLLGAGAPALPWALASLAFLALWTAGPLVNRFIIQILPVMAGTIELGVGSLLRGRPARAAAAGLGAIIVIEAGLLWSDWSADLPARALAAAGAVDREVYRESRLSSWAGFTRWANASLGPGSRVLFYGTLRCAPLTCAFDLASWAEPVPFLLMAAESPGPGRLSVKFRQAGITHVVANRSHAVMWRENLARILPPDHALRTWSEFWRSRASLVFESPRTDVVEGSYAAYDVSGRTPPREAQVILPGIEGFLFVPEALAGEGRPADAEQAFARLRLLAGDYAIVDVAQAAMPGRTFAEARVLLERAERAGLKSVAMYARLAALAPAGSARRRAYAGKARELDPRGAWRALEAAGVAGYRPAVVPPEHFRRLP
ncbi:MAG: hypothetical protein AAB152_06530 [Candidatus Coatesbacteria bacterium]